MKNQSNRKGRSKPIIVDGVKFKSIKAAAIANGISPSLAHERLRDLKTNRHNQDEIDRVFSKPCSSNGTSIKVCGVQYKSIKEAAIANGISPSVASHRLCELKTNRHNQDEIDRVFSKPCSPNITPIKVYGVQYKSINDAIQNLGLNDLESCIRTRLHRLGNLNKNKSSEIDNCFTDIKRKNVGITVHGVKYDRISDAAKAYGLNFNTVESRLGKVKKTEENINSCFKRRNNKPRPITVEQKKFASITQAAKAYGISRTAVTNRLDKLTNPTDDEINNCFLMPVKKVYQLGKIIVKNIEYDNLYEACNAHGVSYFKAQDKLRLLNKESSITQKQINDVFFSVSTSVAIPDDIFILKSKTTRLSPKPAEKHIDVSKFCSGSLGMLFVEASHGKIDITTLGFVDFILEELVSNDVMLSILQKQVGEIYRKEIISLFVYCEDKIANRGLKKQGTNSSQVRYLFKMVEGELLDGGTIASTSLLFKTSLYDEPANPRPILSESQDSYFEGVDEELAQNISNLRFKSIDELNKKIVRHLKARTKRYEDEWWGVVSNYIKEKEYFSTVRDTESSHKVQSILAKDWLSITPGAKRFITQELNAHDVLQVNLGLIDKYKIKEKGILFLNENINTFTLTSSCILKKERNKFKLYSGSSDLSYYLCDKFIPAYVLYCMRCLLQSWFGYNAHTAQNLRLIDIDFLKSDPKKIIITPNKSKTGKDQISKVKYTANSKKSRLFNLLVENHAELVSWDPKLSNESLFIYLEKNLFKDKYVFKPISSQTLKKKFLADTTLPHYTNEQIRDQHVVSVLAESGDVWEAMHVAGHKTLQTLINYADQRILRIANNANINDFMKKLEATILWVVRGNESEVEKMGLSIDDIDETLLFPVTEYGYEEDVPEVDKWIASLESSEAKILLTEMRIEWCLRQYYYYALNWRDLSESNPERFKRVHLPRILMTISLRKVIQDKRPEYYKSALADLPIIIGAKLNE